MTVKMETEATTLPAQDREPQKTIDSSSRGDLPLRWVTSILLLIFPTATLFLNRGDSYVFGILTLIGIWVWLRDGARRWLDRPAALLWIAFALFFAVALLSYLVGTQTDAGFRFLGRYLRFLLVVPVYLALRRYPPTAKTVFIGLALGGLLAGIIGGLHVYRADVFIRVEAMTGLSIIFGDLAVTMTLCTVAGFGLLAISRRPSVILLLVLCVAGGVAGALLSGTRGAWLALFLLVPALALAPTHKWRYIPVTVLALIAMCAIFYFVPRSDLRSRVSNSFSSVESYYIGRNTVVGENPINFTGPRCDDQKHFLEQFVKFLYGPNNPEPSGASVQKDPLLVQTGFCKDGYAVRIRGVDRSRWTSHWFPRLPTVGVGKQFSTILVRGTVFNPFGQDNGGDPVQYAGYTRIKLNKSNWPGTMIAVYVPYGEIAWIVPLDNYYGEYTLAIANTAVGQRFEMWRASWKLFLHHPLLGVGTGAYQDKVAQLIQGGEIFPFVGEFDHPHSDYFNALSSAGIVGSLALLAILIVPLVRFWRALRGKDSVSHAVGLAGALTVLGFAIYALTDTIFLHSMMITWYVIYMALFYALLDVQASKLAKPEPLKQ